MHGKFSELDEISQSRVLIRNGVSLGCVHLVDTTLGRQTVNFKTTYSNCAVVDSESLGKGTKICVKILKS
jgi:hypothetical protein